MLAVGSLAPGFQLDSFSLDGLTAPVLLAFFKITCPTCQLAFPFLQRLADKSGLRIVGVSQDDAAGTAEFREALGVRFETVIDPKSTGYAVSKAYELEFVPALYLIEPGGRIAWKGESFHKAELEAFAAQWGVALFHADDRVPNYKPG